MMLTLLVVLMGALSGESVFAQRTVGVNVDDWADYVVSYQGNSTAMNMEEMANTTRMTFTIVAVSGTNVTLQVHTYYQNGSDTIETGWIDVDTGQNDGNVLGPGMLVAANLSQGDRVYTTSVDPFGEGTINETITTEYLGSTVEVNHFMTNMSSPPNPIMNATLNMSWHWYRTTGIPAEVRFYYRAETSSNMTWFDIRLMVDSIIPEFPLLIILPLFMITTLLASVVYRRKKLR